MANPVTMHALLLNAGGFASGPEGIAIDSLDPYVTLQSIPTPVPKPGQVLIKVRLASVNPSDIMYIKGMYGQARIAGRPAGFEGVGEVVGSGGGFLAGRLRGRRVAFIAGHSGSWSQYAVADAATCIPLRADLRDEDGAALIVNPLTAIAMFDIVRREEGKSFIMTAAASQLGKLITGLSRDEGYQAIAIVRREEQIATVRQHGAAYALDSENESFSDALRAVLREARPKILLDAVTGPLPAKIFSEMGRGGRWVIYGRLDTRPTEIREPGQMIFQGKRIEGFWLSQWMRETSLIGKFRATSAVQKRFASGSWTTDVAAIISLEEAHARLPAALAGANQGKVLLKP
jgi:NADPH:quinone reductase-like Zn-dependent oxidoreductase